MRGIAPISYLGSGKPHASEKWRLAEIIDPLNDVYAVARGLQCRQAAFLADDIECDEVVMAQALNYSEAQVLHGLFLKKEPNALSDQTRFRMPLLEDEEAGGSLLC